MNIRRVKAVARKEFLHILRDPRSLIMALAVPLLMLLLFGYALTLDVDRIPTLVYDSDDSPESRALIDRFEGSRYFAIIGHTNRYEEIEKRIDSSQVLLGLVIPNDYSQDLKSGREAAVQLLLDGSDSNTAAIALGYARALLQTHLLDLQATALNQRELSAPVVPQLRVWYNSDLRSKNYIVPGLIAVILMIIAALLTSLTIAREWEMGTMEQLLSTPLRPAELVLGKMLAFFSLGLVDMLIAIGVSVYIFDVPLRGNPLFLMVTGCVFLFGALCWGVFLSATARSQLLAYQLGMVTSFLPAFLLSGFIYAVENMPQVIQLATYVVPARYFVTVLQGIFLKGIGPALLWMELLFLLIFAAVVFSLAVRKLHRKLV
jgi:ABC-2 type transport system permease protein